MNRETGDAHLDGQSFEQGLVGLRKDSIVSSNQLQPESGDLQRMTMVQFGLHDSYGRFASPRRALCSFLDECKVAITATMRIAIHHLRP
jgi:hypothetical protein